jgi:hypothetical protein
MGSPLFALRFNDLLGRCGDETKLFPKQANHENKKEHNNTGPEQESLLPREVRPVEGLHRTFTKDSPPELLDQARLNDR